MRISHTLIISSLFKLHRYPGYFRLLLRRYLLPFLVSRMGVCIKGTIDMIGLPIVSKSSNSTIEIGAESLLCSNSKSTALGVNHPIILRTISPESKIIIGKGVRMSGTSICAGKRVVIGNRVVIGVNVTLFDTDIHAKCPALRASNMDAVNALSADVVICDDAFIGAGSIIMKGVHIGYGAIVSAGAVVNKDVADFSIVIGNPAREINHI